MPVMNDGDHSALRLKCIVKFSSITGRLVAVTLLFFVLGLQFVSAKSTSHELVAHTQHADGSHHVNADESEEGAVPLLFSDAGEDHSHKHDPSDHTHDIPLHLALESTTSTFTAIWVIQSPKQLYSVSTIPFERPPKHMITY